MSVHSRIYFRSLENLIRDTYPPYYTIPYYAKRIERMIKRKYIFLEFLLDSTDSLLTSESSESVSDREIVDR